MESISLPLDDLELTTFLDSSIWIANTPRIFFSIVEWQKVDKVKLQFHLQQGIPGPPKKQGQTSQNRRARLN